jgi:molybdopterin/thiamine biosynthesis adenylyltransferase
VEPAEALRQAARDGVVAWKDESAAALEFGLSAREVEGAALHAGLRLERYARNFRSIDVAGQLRLHEARVAVIGCGGLGGHIIEELARLGVGSLVVVDSDRFEPSNLNRQILCSLATLGRPKVEVAAERVASINPAARVLPLATRFDADNAEAIISGAHAAADALDTISSRLALAAACSRLGIRLVHGGIAGHYVQVATVEPGSRMLDALYGGATGDRGIEVELGNPAFTPAIAASLQVSELVRILVGATPALAGQFFHLDLERMESTRFALG